MDAKEICEKYCDNGMKADIVEDVVKLFSSTIDKELSEEYDLEEMATELLAFYQNERGLPKLEELLGMLEKYNLSIYKEVFQLFAIDLIKHYCYQNERSKAQNAFSGFLKYPNSDVGLFFMGLEILGYYGFNEFVEYACNQTVEAIKKHEGEDSYSAPEMMKFIYPIVTEQLYKEHSQSSDFSPIDKELARFSDVDGKISEGNFFLEAVFTEESQGELITNLFLKERGKSLHMIEGKFVRYMLGKGMNFYTSMSIWAKMTGYWDENSHSRKELKPDFYFRLSKKSYQEYIQKYNKRGILDSNYEGAAIAWGSFYIYEFLHQELKLISKKLFDTFWEIATAVRGEFIGRYFHSLHELSFVNRWGKPSDLDEKVRFHEGKIFEKSFDVFNDDGVQFSEFKEKIKENLAEMGEVASAIVKGGEAGDAQMEEMRELFEKFVSDTGGEYDSLEEDYFDDEEEVEDIDYEEMPPYFKEPQKPMPKVSEKVGRNEPCPCGSGKKYKKCCGK